ncbi:hypothetical protein AZE42_11983 [Rhizopogon vesiculosus]|uniref:Uncharacterized protein n=1 Tax=Rhizopogon vesiculosus TaxID=180088 RepID=A0A1J8QPZ7_9AGAM|nr:hypothetical protein AZE42_11983 [Rhizopogon vesiculosus]
MDQHTYRRKLCKVKQERRQSGADGQIMAEKIELDDLEFLNLFTTTDAWVQLSNSVQ